MNTKALTIPVQNAPLETINKLMGQAGQAANKAAGRRAFDTAMQGKSNNTIRRKIADLALFETFLNSAGVPAHDLYHNPQAWRGVTWGIVEAFKSWMLSEGYAIGSINGRLSTVRNHAKLAQRAGVIEETEARMIASVGGYSSKEARHVDAKRTGDGIATRKGSKKAHTVIIPEDIAEALVSQPNTPKGRRDALLMCIILEHGLRVSEVALLTVKSFDLKANTFTFYRPKVDITQTHKLTPNTRKAAAAYIKHDAPASGIIWRRSAKGSDELGKPLSNTQPGAAERALTKRVELLGRKAGVIGLSAHDGRHYWATYEASKGTPVDRLKDAGGWNSPAMPLRYIGAAAIANERTARIKE